MEEEIRKIIDLYFNPNFGRELAVELLRGYNYEFIEMFENGQFENFEFENFVFKVEFKNITFDSCTFRNCKFNFDIFNDSFLNCDFIECDFSNKHLHRWILLDNQFSNCIFVNAYLSIDDDDELGISGDFRGATFCGNFEIYGDVEGADFSESNFYSESAFKMSMKSVLAPSDVDQYFIDCSYDFSETSFADYPLSELIFEEIDLYDVDFSGADLEGAIFIDCELNGANFEGANLEGAVFLSCDLSDTNFSDASMIDTAFKDCIDVMENIYHDSFYEIEDYDFEEALGEKLKLRADYIFDKKLKFDDFDGCALDSVDFSGIQMEFVSFKNASLVNADFSNSVLTDVDFSGANLTHANFTNAVLINVIFEDALLENTVFDEDYKVDFFESYVEEGVEEPDEEDIYNLELDWEDL